MAYRALYLFFRSGENDGCRDFSIYIRPSLGVFLEASIRRVSQNLKIWPNVALKLAKHMCV